MRLGTAEMDCIAFFEIEDFVTDPDLEMPAKDTPAFVPFMSMIRCISRSGACRRRAVSGRHTDDQIDPARHPSGFIFTGLHKEFFS